MKRIIDLCLIAVLCLILTSCGKESKPAEVETGSTGADKQIMTEESVQNNSTGNYGVYDMSGDFTNMVKNNPLDKDYNFELKKLNESKDFSNMLMLQICSK
ncbi:MAG: hypothetical protein PHT78_10180 [Desulfitobacteriaceae bacterium]|nr:hypothetical protein [Desulfitobacteriaceae bacterium]MDD4753594.1 hypothetical protein [Desulfitobacteriaceae bacterium]